MTSARRLAAASLALALASSFLSAAGCGGVSAGAICGDICDCQGCSESEQEDCEDDVDDTLREAEADGCGEQADALIDCWASELECKDDRVVIDGCRPEEEAYAECGNGGSLPGATPCDQLGRAAEDGGCGGGGGDGAECSGELEQAAYCYLDTIANVCAPTTEELTAYSECVGG